MTDKTSLGDRMKVYEKTFKQSLPIRMPVVIRVDGKSFHTYTKSLKRPGQAYNEKLEEVMNTTAIKLCEEVQGVQMAYVQSDEISLLLHNYKTLNSQSWFGNELQKMVSISAAIASVTFTENSWKIWGQTEQDLANGKIKCLPLTKPAYFDSRAFVLPEAEVCNYFIWRQQDATRNSIQSLARSLYSHKECHNKNNQQLQEMCFEAGRNWNDEPITFRRGRCIIQEEKTIDLSDRPPTLEAEGKIDDEPIIFDVLSVTRKEWIVDEEIPIFTQDREYVNKHLLVDET